MIHELTIEVHGRQAASRIGLMAGDAGSEAKPAIGHSADSPLIAAGSARHSAQRKSDCYLSCGRLIKRPLVFMQ
jgi:hypothetical protein